MEYTYEQYCNHLDEIQPLMEGDILSESISDILGGIKGKIGKILRAVQTTFVDIGGDIKLTARDIINAFKDKSIFGVLKAFGFSLSKILKSIEAATSLLHKGIEAAFIELHKTKAVQALANGVKSLDEFLDKHPILKKLTGPAVAGLLILTWLNMTFVGNFDYDMDIGIWFEAALGKFSLYEFFASPHGLTMITFLATGIISGGALSVSWLGSTPANLAAAISYVALKKIRRDDGFLIRLRHKIIKKEIGVNQMKTFKEHRDFETGLTDEELQESILQILALKEMTLEESNELFDGDMLVESRLHDALSKAGLHLGKSKGLIQYVLGFGRGIGKLVVAAIRGDTKAVKEIVKTVNKEDVIDFLLKLDQATLHLVTGPIHMIDSLTGWHLWAAVKSTAEKAGDIVVKIKNAIETVKQGVIHAYDTAKKKRAMAHIKNLESELAIA